MRKAVGDPVSDDLAHAPVGARRARIAEAVRALGSEASMREPSLGTLLTRLADAIEAGRSHEASGYIAAVDPHALAELLAGAHSRLWAILEVARNVLVFAPIAVTWFGLSTAATAYAAELAERPEMISQPFLLLWQQNFGGRGFINFSSLALTDATLIGVLIVLSLMLHIRSELRDAATRTRALLKESEIRATLGEAASLGAMDLGEADSESLLAELVAEERRIYERAMEREGQLFDLEASIRELRAAAEKLDRVAESLSRVKT